MREREDLFGALVEPFERSTLARELDHLLRRGPRTGTASSAAVAQLATPSGRVGLAEGSRPLCRGALERHAQRFKRLRPDGPPSRTRPEEGAPVPTSWLTQACVPRR